MYDKNDTIYVISIGTLCLPMIFAQALEKSNTAVRIRGFIDNIIVGDRSISPETLVECVLKNDYTISKEPIIEEASHIFEIEPGIGAKFLYHGLGYQIVHNDPRTKKYKQEFFKRYLNWKNAVYNREDVIYLLNIDPKDMDMYLDFFPKKIKNRIITLGEAEWKQDITYSFGMHLQLSNEDEVEYCSKEFKRVLYERGLLKS